MSVPDFHIPFPFHVPSHVPFHVPFRVLVIGRARTLGFIPDPKNKERQSKNGVEVNKFRCIEICTSCIGTLKKLFLGEDKRQVNNVTVFLLQDIVSTKRLSGVSEKHRQRNENNETKKTVWI